MFSPGFTKNFLIYLLSRALCRQPHFLRVKRGNNKILQSKEKNAEFWSFLDLNCTYRSPFAHSSHTCTERVEPRRRKEWKASKSKSRQCPHSTPEVLWLPPNPTFLPVARCACWVPGCEGLPNLAGL